MPWPCLVTERLELRSLPAGTAAVLPMDRSRASRHLGARLHDQWPGADLLGVLPRQVASSPETARFGIWVIIEHESGTVVGDVGFHGPPDDGGTIEIGYFVVPDRRRRGYATEAAGVLLKWAAAQPAVRCIVAACAPDNVPSIRTLERVGFFRTGEEHGDLRWTYRSDLVRI